MGKNLILAQQARLPPLTDPPRRLYNGSFELAVSDVKFRVYDPAQDVLKMLLVNFVNAGANLFVQCEQQTCYEMCT